MTTNNAPGGEGPLIYAGGTGLAGAGGISVARERPRPEPEAGPPGSRVPLASRRWVRITAGFLIPVILLVVWQVAATSGAFTSSQLPTPAMVWEAAVDLAQRGLLGLYVAISTQRVLIGFAIGAALGLLLGALVGLSRWSDILFSPTLAAIRAVPSLAWVPLLILWFKIGEDSKIILIAIGAFFPVYTTVAAALKHVDRHLVEAGRAFGLNGVRLFTTVQLPAVLPSVISGLRLALAQAWLFLVAAELIASSMGLGFLLSDSQNNGRTDRLFLAIILLAVLGKITDSLLGLFERWAARRWA
ncbi:MAG: ABC transporter permease [Leifsonia sp.]